ncbi:hypothetical protein [Nocardia sp. BMG51109]|uniref:hypothetical protein n=1 Tax=Nocardia sp. BMG51109 TaxID=1056816 RepID=UPI00046399F0|nr:hypothetical protein [Nocardia sp. BMG51109]
MSNAETGVGDTPSSTSDAPPAADGHERGDSHDEQSGAAPDIAFTLGGSSENAAPSASAAVSPTPAPVPSASDAAMSPASDAASPVSGIVSPTSHDRSTHDRSTHDGAAVVAPGSPATTSAPGPDDAPADPEVYVQKLAHAIVDTVLPNAPADWQRLDMVFSVTVRSVSNVAFCTDDLDNITQVEVPRDAVELVQLLRAITVPLQDRAWWRVLLHHTGSDVVNIEYDYGDFRFDADELQPPEAYRADLETYPRDRVPVWLAAYMHHGDRQSRTAWQAVVQARVDRENGVGGVPLGLPDPQVLWARWTTVAAAAVAIGSENGPRIVGSAGLFEATDGSGSTLYLLPGNRAVLSGGRWDAPELEAAYNQDAELPNHYAGAPEWLANPILNQRAATGMLTFCYWWDGSGWYRGESPDPPGIGPAIPGVWTTGTVVDVVCAVLGEQASRPVVAELAEAAETHGVTADIVLRAFDIEGSETDLAGAMYQFALAGLTA